MTCESLDRKITKEGACWVGKLKAKGARGEAKKRDLEKQLNFGGLIQEPPKLLRLLHHWDHRQKGQ